MIAEPVLYNISDTRQLSLKITLAELTKQLV